MHYYAKLMHETRHLMIRITSYYLKHHLQLPLPKHYQYIRLVAQLKARHNTFALACDRDLL